MPDHPRPESPDIRLLNPISDLLLLEPDDVGILESVPNGERAAIFFVRIWSKLFLENGQYERFVVRNTGDAFPKKICNICHKLLDTTLHSPVAGSSQANCPNHGA
jgi:hypothetical protein